MTHNQFDPSMKFYQSLRAFTAAGDGEKSFRQSKERCRHFNPCPPYFPLIGKIRRGGKSIS